MASNVSLSVGTTSCLSTCLVMGTWAASILADVQNAAVNIGVRVSLELVFCISSDKYSEGDFLGHEVLLFLIF